MDVDPPPPLSQPGLKRSSSAPMIASPDCESSRTAAAVVDQSTAGEPSSSPRTSPTFVLCSSFEPRTRRFSASFSPLHSPTPGSPCFPSRVNQLKQEETRDVAGREAASEKEFQSTIQISQSWEDLSLSDSDSKNDCRVSVPTEQLPPSRPPSACTEPIHVTLPTGLSPFVSSPYPSPTRERVSGHRQCFSPSMQIPVRNSSFSPTPSPSPTRKTFYTSRRSLSPIAIRPSPLGPVKRKCDLDDRSDSSWVPNKKYQTYFTATSTSGLGNPLNGPATLLGLTHPLTHTSSTEIDPSDGHSAGIPLLNNNATVIPTPDSLSDSASTSTPGSSNPTTPSPLLSSQVKLLDSPAGSPQSAIAAPIATAARRNSMSSSCSNSSSSSRSSVCVVPSPLAATVVEDVVVAAKKTIRPDRKDFSRLFVPIPPSPTNAMDCCHHETVDDQMVVESVDDPVPQQHSTMSVDSSHLPMDPSI